MSEKTPPQLPHGRTVLVVEDELRLRELLSRVVKELGLQPTTASSAEQALRLMDQRVYDILMIDLNLPGKSGLELLQQARTDGVNSQAIILTGFGDLEAARAAIHLDVAEFLCKPCPLGDIDRAIGKALSRAKLPNVVQENSINMVVDQASPKTKTEQGSSNLADVERMHILSILSKHSGNRAATAAELGISIRTLYYRLEQYEREGHLK